MDPAFWEARDRFKQKKSKPGKPENVFEREFRKNPFAQALATPVRYDSVTRLRMPHFFFQDFNIVSHPETDTPWWVPRSLALRESPISPTASGSEDQVTIENIGNESAAEAPVGKQANFEKKAPAAHVFGPTAYVLARQELLRTFQEEPKKGKGARAALKDVGNSQFHRRLFGPSSSRFRTLAGRAVWREDMDVYVLEQMRQQIVQDLMYLSGLCETDGRYYIVKCYGWDDIKFKHKGAVLWFEGVGEEQVKPGPFATFDVQADGKTDTAVAVHNLPMLLGTELAQKVRTEAAALKDGSIFMLAGRRTTDLQLRLWKLQGYMYDFEGPT
ncbi:hypothetical protein TruAng_000736 [Truncatella angustata]|nr:hypothetical protein TruAng_000736 [Truncatella angustata]